MKSNFESLIDHLPFWHFEEDLMVFYDGSLGTGFKLKGIDISLKPTDAINGINLSLENLLTTAREGLKFQIFFKVTPDVSEVIKNHQETSSSENSKFVEVSRARIDFFKKRLQENSFFKPEIYFFMRSPKFSYGKKKFFQSEKKFEPIAKEMFEQHHSQFVRDIKQVESSLSSIGLEPKRLENDKWFELLFNYFNLSRSESIDVPKLHESSFFQSSLSEQIILSDLMAGSGKIKIGNYYFKSVNLQTLPESTYAGMIENLLMLPFHFWLSQNIHILDQKSEYNKLNLKRKMTHSFASGSKNVSDLESENKLNDMENLLSELIQSSEKILDSDISIIIYDKSEQALEEKANEVLRTMKALSQAEGILETYAGFDSFIKSSPGVCEGLRLKKLKSSNVAHLMPVYSSWEGNEKAVNLFVNRSGNLLKINPFDPKDISSYNGLIVGSSGSGKSFTVNQIVLQFLGQTL